MKRNNANPLNTVKTIYAILLLLAGETLAQVPPPGPTASTNAPALTTAPGTNAAPAATNLDARRRAFQQMITNRLSRAATNLPALPLPPPPGASTNAATPTPATAQQTTNAPAPTAPPAPGAFQPPASQTPLPTNATTQGDRPEHLLKFNNAPVDQIFEKYSELTGRTVLRPATLQASITIINYTPLTRAEAIQAMDGVLALNNITMVPEGEKFIKAVPSLEAPQQGAAISSLKHSELPEGEQFITYVASLKVAKPSEVAQLFASFTKNPTGIVPIDSSQILVLRDYSSNIKRMLDLLRQIDVTSETDYKLEVIPIKYGKVTDLFETMNQLVSGSGGGAGGSLAGSRGAAQQRRSGQLPTTGGGALGTTGGGRYGTSRAGGTYGQPQANQPFQPAGAQPGTAGGNTFQNRLNQIVNRAAQGSEVQLLADARIVPDERSNSLIVFANKQDIQMITNIVSKVDVLLAQVLIEGIVVSVSIGDDNKLGVSWVQNPVSLGNNSVGAGGINNGPGFLTNLTALASSLQPGFSYFANLGKNFQASIQAIATDNHARVLQRPRIQTSHAVPGYFFTGSTVPYVTGFYNYGGLSSGTQSTVEQVQVGVTLQVTPYITPDGLVVLDIDQDISSLDGFVTIDNNDVPKTVSRHATATLSVHDGETIMLGGYIEDNRSTKKSGVPILKDIPGLGALFRSKEKNNSRSELMLLMHVTILKDPVDASAQVAREKAKLPGISEADKEFKKTEEQSLKKAGLEAKP